MIDNGCCHSYRPQNGNARVGSGTVGASTSASDGSVAAVATVPRAVPVPTRAAGDPLGRDREQRRRLHRRVDGIGAVLAGGANVALQLSWRPVARGVLESPVASGSIFTRPLKRTRTTL